MDDECVSPVALKDTLTQKDAYLLFYCRKEIQVEYPAPPSRSNMSAAEATETRRMRARARSDSFTSASSFQASSIERSQQTEGTILDPERRLISGEHGVSYGDRKRLLSPCDHFHGRIVKEKTTELAQDSLTLSASKDGLSEDNVLAECEDAMKLTTPLSMSVCNGVAKIPALPEDTTGCSKPSSSPQSSFSDASDQKSHFKNVQPSIALQSTESMCMVENVGAGPPTQKSKEKRRAQDGGKIIHNRGHNGGTVEVVARRHAGVGNISWAAVANKEIAVNFQDRVSSAEKWDDDENYGDGNEEQINLALEEL
ncbi:MAG: hypothetical protein ACREOZ_04745, partial [Gloeomargaritales cyanobacterium]